MHSMKSRALILTVALAALAFAPAIALAAAPTDFFPIVRCNTTDNPTPCTPCGLFEAADNVINLILFGITGPIGVFLIILSGGMFVVGAGNPTVIKQARDMLTRTLLGVTIILVSWVATTLLMKTVAGASVEGTPWYEFSCPTFLQQDGEEDGVTPQTPGSSQPAKAALQQALITTCEPSKLAARSGLPFTETKRNAQDLTKMMGCIEQDPIVKRMIEGAEKSTYDKTYPLCNLTRGKPICSASCSHCSAAGCFGSCHYGGDKGNDGAEAVDYNSNLKSITYIKASTSIGRMIASGPDDMRCKNDACRTVRGDRDLHDEIYRSIVMNGCDYKFLNFEGDHTHVSAPSCDRDGRGLSKNMTRPILP